MLTQGPAPDPKCKLTISYFLTLPHLLDYLICTRNTMSIVLLLGPKMDLAEMYYYQTIKLGTQSKLYEQNYSQMIFAI